MEIFPRIFANSSKRNSFFCYLQFIAECVLCLRQIIIDGSTRHRCRQFKNERNKESNKSQLHQVDGFVRENGHYTIFSDIFQLKFAEISRNIIYRIVFDDSGHFCVRWFPKRLSNIYNECPTCRIGWRVLRGGGIKNFNKMSWLSWKPGLQCVNWKLKNSEGCMPILFGYRKSNCTPNPIRTAANYMVFFLQIETITKIIRTKRPKLVMLTMCNDTSSTLCYIE